jgi:uncharacterized protein (TIGR00730 family)
MPRATDRRIERICVFCGSRPGARPEYLDAARRLGSLLAERRIGLVYGGASVGIMGAVANAVLKGGGEVIGVIPRAMVDRELAHDHLTELRIVNSMHERKALMADLSHAFIALPGGYGTADEFFEMLTWAQLKIHRKPIGLLNTADYFDPLLAWIDRSVTDGFLKPIYRDMLLIDNDAERLLDKVLG